MGAFVFSAMGTFRELDVNFGACIVKWCLLMVFKLFLGFSLGFVKSVLIFRL